MECSGFSSPRTDAFPAGLRVLVVDDDPTWLKILEKMLKKCSYEVTTCCLAREALDRLRERKDGYDIVISDVNMPDMDGFKLLELVGLEMDLPVIMMSVDGETSRVMKGVQHGACDYLLKPIRMKELRNIWQHVFRKKILEVRDIESHDGIDEIFMMRNGLDQSDDGYSLSGVDLALGKKRKDFENKCDEKDFGDSSLKKARVVWTVDLHQKFVKAVNHIGFDKVGPKKILDLMKVPWLTRENVASHLQKYRLYLSRLQKENDLKASFGGTKNADPSSKDHPIGNLGSQDPINTQLINAANGNYVIPSNILIQNANPKIHETDLKSIVSLPMAEPTRASLIADIPENHIASSSRVGLNHSFGLLESDVNYSAFDSTVPAEYSWSREDPAIQFQQEHKPHIHLENGLNEESDKPANIECKPSNATKCINEHMIRVTPGGTSIDLFSMQPERRTTNLHPFESISSTAWDMRNQHVDQVSINNLEPSQGNLIFGRGSAFQFLDEDLPTCLLRGQSNFGLQNKELFGCNDPELVTEVPPYLYDALRFDYEYPCDSMEYPVIDQGLFIA